MKDCIFCKIAKGEIPKELEYEDDLAIAFPDINPIAPVHLLIIPKQHIEKINDLPDGEEGDRIAGHLINVAKQLAKTKGIDEKGHKLIFRTGRHGGQEVPHIHLHLIGGARLSEGIGPVRK